MNTLPSSVPDRHSGHGDHTHSGKGRIRAPLAAVSFWSAILVPLVYPLLFLTGVETVPQFALLGSVIALHALSLLGGHHYHAAGE